MDIDPPGIEIKADKAKDELKESLRFGFEILACRGHKLLRESYERGRVTDENWQQSDVEQEDDKN